MCGKLIIQRKLRVVLFVAWPQGIPMPKYITIARMQGIQTVPQMAVQNFLISHSSGINL